MFTRVLRILIISLLIIIIACSSENNRTGQKIETAETLVIRVATFNVEDIREDDLKSPGHPRLKKIAAIIQEMRPDIILINEIAYDQAGAPGFEEGDAPGQNGQRLTDNFISEPQGPGLAPLRYRAFMAPSNTGISSGFDLNNDADTVTAYPTPPAADSKGNPAPQTAGGRAYGNDCWGFGTFPGQYAMALLVNKRFEILDKEVRTFQYFPWNAMPNALLPSDPKTGEAWYSADEQAVFRLSSKSHWDVPVKLPNGIVLHLLCSHPTPPAFDGPEQRNKRRNHDEIRFWADYLNGADYIVDDAGRHTGLPDNSRFVILGDLNADPDEGASLNNPIAQFLLKHSRINGDFVPTAPTPNKKLDADDTALWGLRVDYVLPSKNMTIIEGGIWRYSRKDLAGDMVSDHFPVWIDLAVP